jgi:hypothetical protein
LCAYKVTGTALGVGKQTCSRLRPNFLDACRPANLSRLCPPGVNAFITEYVYTRFGMKK